MKKQQSNKNTASKLIVVGATAAVALVAALGCAYAWGANQYEGKFLPNMMVNGHDVSGKTAAEVEEYLSQQNTDMRITIDDGEEQAVITGDDIDLTIDHAALDASFKEQDNWAWFAAQLGEVEDVSVGISYDESKLESKVDALPCMGADRKDPVDATIEYADGEFKAVGAEAGNKADRDAVLAKAKELVDAGGGEIDASETYKQPKYTADSPEVKTAVEEANRWISKDISYNIDGIDKAESLDKDTIASFIIVDQDKFEATLDDEKIRAWLHGIGGKYDTVGTERPYKTASGKEGTLSGGSYGWITDEAAMLPVVKEDITGSLDIVNNDFKYQQTANGPKGSSELGDTYMEVDRTDQMVRYIKDGKVVFEADTVTGTNTPKRETQTGFYSILWKDTNHIMKGEINPATGRPEYETPCDYFILFNSNGSACHDATWRGNWSKSAWKNGDGSHGCCNMHYNDVKELFGLCSEGDPVIVHD